MKSGYLLLAAALAASAAPPEIRGVWVARNPLVSRERIAETMEDLRRANFNLVFVNVWSQGYPLWRSEVFFRETGLYTDPQYGDRDVLAEAVAEAAARGLAVMPWVEYGFVAGWSGRLPAGSLGPVLDAHPDWLAKKRDGDHRFPVGSGCCYYWLSHTHPDAQKFLLGLMRELAASYDVPGIQFDRARYPQLDCGYDEATARLYAEERDGASLPENPADPGWMRWRAAKLNLFVRNLHRSIRDANWRALVTNAPIVYNWSYVNYLQEYPVWMKEGWLEFVSPQVYRYDMAGFERELDNQLRYFDDPSRIAPGLTIDSTGTPELLANQIRLVREKGLPGAVVWHYEPLKTKGALQFLKETVFAEPASLPWR